MRRINLLPKSKQRELAYEKVFYSVTVAVILAVIILLVGVVVQFGVWTYLDRRITTTDAEIEQLKKLANKAENTAVKQRIREVNAQIEDFVKLADKTPQWSKVTAAFVQHVPEGVRITDYDANLEKSQIMISGYSPTRDLVIDLYNNINADKVNFKNINYPLENVAQPTNVRFSFTFFVADGVLTGEVK